MPNAIITTTEIAPGASLSAIQAGFRKSFADCGFGTTNFDDYPGGGTNDRNYVIQHTLNPNHVGRSRNVIYLRIRLVFGTSSTGNSSILISAFETWNTTSKTGTNQDTELSIATPNNQTIFYYNNTIYPLKLYAYSHPEIKGIIMQQEDRFGEWFLLTPANSDPDFGFDNNLYSLYFCTTDFLTCHTRKGYGSGNPNNNDGIYDMSYFTNLRYKNTRFGLNTYQKHPLHIWSRDLSGSPAYFTDLYIFAGQDNQITGRFNDSDGLFSVIDSRKISSPAVKIG